MLYLKRKKDKEQDLKEIAKIFLFQPRAVYLRLIKN